MDLQAARRREAAVHNRSQAVAFGQQIGQGWQRFIDGLVPRGLVRAIMLGLCTAVDPATHTATFLLPGVPGQTTWPGVRYGYPWRAPRVGERLPVFIADVGASQMAWVEPPGGRQYVLYYIDTEHYLCRVDWPPTNTAPYWTGFRRGTAIVPGDYTDTVLGVLDGGATVVVVDRGDVFGDPTQLYGLDATDLTTMQWGPRSYGRTKLYDRSGGARPTAFGTGVASPDGGLVGMIQLTDLPITFAAWSGGVHGTWGLWTSPDGLATAGRSVDAIDFGTVGAPDFFQAVPWPYRYYGACGAWLTPDGQPFACWLWHRTDETAPAALTFGAIGAQPMHWDLMTSEASATPTRQILPRAAVADYDASSDFGPAGGVGYDPDTQQLTVYASFDMDSSSSGNTVGHIEVGTFTRSGAGTAWTQVGDWRNALPLETEQLWVVSDNGVHAWAQRGFWQSVTSVDYWTADAGATWAEFPPDLPPLCPRPGDGSSLRTLHSINRAPA